MSAVIPTSRELSSYTQRTQIDGRDYLLRFQFNQRIGRWSMDVFDQDEDPIAHGLALRTGAQIGRGIRDTRFPPGALMVIDQVALTAQESRDPGLFELGDRFLLTYFTAEEVEAAGG